MENVRQANGIGGLGPEDERQQALERMRTASSVSMSPELFEKMFLSPPTAVRGDLRKKFANPTPMLVPGTLLVIRTISYTC